jgi:hypothetical protein
MRLGRSPELPQRPAGEYEPGRQTLQGLGVILPGEEREPGTLNPALYLAAGPCAFEARGPWKRCSASGLVRGANIDVRQDQKSAGGEHASDFAPSGIGVLHQREDALAQHGRQATVFKGQTGCVAPHEGQAGIPLPGAAEHAGGTVEPHGPKTMMSP